MAQGYELRAEQSGFTIRNTDSDRMVRHACSTFDEATKKLKEMLGV